MPDASDDFASRLSLAFSAFLAFARGSGVLLALTSAVEIYAKDEYWIRDDENLHHKVEYIEPADTKAPEVFIAEDINLLSYDMDHDVLNDLKYLGEERTDAILRQIIDDCEEEHCDDIPRDESTELSIHIVIANKGFLKSIKLAPLRYLNFVNSHRHCQRGLPKVY